jgi:eukaryotic-like serine/threonine-protein kinase
MKACGIRVGTGPDLAILHRVGEAPRFLTVSGSWISVVHRGDWRALNGFTLSEELIIGERRVYGRLTQAREGSETFPICMELVDIEDGKRGVRREDDGSPNAAKVFSSLRVRAVDRFE